jgi:hypothetical protein
MKNLIKLIAIGTLGVAAAGCQVNKTQQGKLPDVQVKTTGGQLPHYNVQGPDVQVGEKTVEVKTPTIKVVTPAHKG